MRCCSRQRLCQTLLQHKQINVIYWYTDCTALSTTCDQCTERVCDIFILVIVERISNELTAARKYGLQARLLLHAREAGGRGDQKTKIEWAVAKQSRSMCEAGQVTKEGAS